MWEFFCKSMVKRRWLLAAVAGHAATARHAAAEAVVEALVEAVRDAGECRKHGRDEEEQRETHRAPHRARPPRTVWARPRQDI